MTVKVAEVLGTGSGAPGPDSQREGGWWVGILPLPGPGRLSESDSSLLPGPSHEQVPLHWNRWGG